MNNEINADILVIGSGFGGAVAASVLAEAGLNVTLLERGPWRDTVPVRSMNIDKRAPLPRGWKGLFRVLRSVNNTKLLGGGLTANKRGLFEVFFAKGLNVVCSSGVGGGSHVYSGLNVPPPDPNYWNGLGGSLSSQSMQSSYERVLAKLGSRPAMADDQLPNTLADRFANNPEIESAGADYELTVGMLFPETPGATDCITNEDGVERFPLIPGEDGNLGSEKGGKTTLDFAYLAKAIKCGLQVRDLHEVLTVHKTEEQNAYKVHALDHHHGERVTYTAPFVFMGAGTMNTLKILLQSVNAGGLNASTQLGKRFGGNGDFIGYWDHRDTARDLSVGMPARGLIKVRDKNPLGPDRDWPMVAEGAFPSPKMLPLGGWISKKLRQGTFVAGMGADAQNGEVSLKRGKLRVKYDPDESELFGRIKAAFRVMGEKTGAKVYHFQRPTTVHPTGGAAIGSDADNGVIDANGEMFTNPGIFVVDAAALPKPIAGPPSLSIAAWSDHVARNFINKTEHLVR